MKPGKPRPKLTEAQRRAKVLALKKQAEARGAQREKARAK